jgi:hypothetical protein
LILISGTALGSSTFKASKKSLTGKLVGAAALLTFVSTGCLAAQAQTRAPRRESSANRKNRIQRTIEETYTHRWEVGGGAGYLRFQPGEFKKQNNNITFWGSALYSLNPKLGIVGMAGGAFGSAYIGNVTPTAVNPQIQNYDFLAGPSYRIVRKEKFSVSAYGAGGIGWGRFSTGPKDFPATSVGLWPSGFAPAFSAGVNLDYNLFPNLSARITPNYLGTTYGSTIQNGKGLNFGLVYRFGHIK